MDFTDSNNSRRQKRKKRNTLRSILITFGVILLLCFGLIAFLPFMLSTNFARERILAVVNQSLPSGSVNIEAWSFSWFQEQSLSGITYEDPKTQTTASIQKITTSSLWHLLPLGHMTMDLCVDTPIVTMPLPVSEPKPAAKPSAQAGAPRPAAKPTADPTPSEPASFALPAWDIALNLKVIHAQVTCPQLPLPLIQNGQLALSLPALDQAAQLSLKTTLLDMEVKTDAATIPVEHLFTAPLSLNAIQQANASIQSAWINCSTAITAASVGTFPKATLDLSLDTGKAFAFVRPLNCLPPALSSISGQLNLAAQLTPLTAEQLQTTCTVTTQDFACAYDGKPLLCAPKISADVCLNPSNLMDVDVRQLNVTLPGITLNGAGTLTNGTLSATLATEPIWETFGSFIGDYPLQLPLDVTLVAKALADNLTVQINATHKQKPLGDLSLTVEALDPIAQSFKSLKLNSHWYLAKALSAVCPLPEKVSADGDIYLNLAATGTFDNLRSNLSFAYHNANISAAPWKIKEASLIEGSAVVAFKSQTLSLTDLTLSSPITQLTGALSAQLAPTLTANGTLKGTLTPEIVMKKWRVWGKNEQPLNLKGAFDYAITAQKQDGITLNATLNSKDFTLIQKAAEAISLPIDLTLDLANEGAKTTLKQCLFTTNGLALNATGTYAADADALALKGTLTPDFDTLFATFPPLKKNRDTFAMSGKHARTFSFEAPLLQGLPGILNYGKGSAEVAFDRVTVPGLDIPKGVVDVTLKESVAAVEGVVTVNEGTVNLQPRLNLSGKTPILTWEPNSKILNRVRLTPELFNTALGAINPMLTDSADPNGYLTLTCESLHMPLDQQPLLSLDTRLTLKAESCSLRPNGSIKKVLSTVLGKSSTLQMADKAFDVTIVKGILTTEPISVQVDNLTFACEGSTNLATQAINYKVTLPLHEKILGKKLAKSAKAGETVVIPIQGTIKHPEIDIAPLVKAFSSTAVEKAKDKLTEKLEKALKKHETKREEKTQQKTQQKDKKEKSNKERREELLEEALRGLFGK